jgi:acetyl esterase/lipase
MSTATAVAVSLVGLGAGAVSAVDDPGPSAAVVRPTPSTPVRFAPDGSRRVTEVSYGPLDEHRIAVYQPIRPSAGAASIVYVHGGGWVGGDELLGQLSAPGESPHLIEQLATRPGQTVFSVRYRLAPDPAHPELGGSPFPAALLDVNRAVRWVKAHAAEYGIDPDRVIVYGWSAGGHLAAMLGTTWNVPTLQPDALPLSLVRVSPRPAGVVSIAGPLDPEAWGDANPDRSNVFSGGAVIASFAGCSGRWYTSCGASALDAIDVTNDADPSDPPMYIAHGDLDGIVPAGSQRAAVRRLVAALGVDRVVDDLTDAGPPDQRNHVPDAALDRVRLLRFLTQPPDAAT